MAPFATYVDFEKWSGESVPLDAQDNIDYLLSRASGIIREWSDWHVAPSVSETIRVSGRGGSILQLPTKHVTEVNEIAWADRRFQTPLVLDPNYYTWSESGLVQLMGNYYPWWLEWTPNATAAIVGWPDTLDSITVDLTHGFDPVPDPIVNVTCEMVANALAVPHGGISALQIGSILMSFDQRRDAIGMLRLEIGQIRQLVAYQL